MSWLRVLRNVLAAGAVVVVGLAGWVRSLLWFPDDVEPAEVVCAPDAPVLPRGGKLKVLVWNVQYAGSRDLHFWYDGGEDVHVPPETVTATLDRLGQVVRELDPDLILWQEIDRDSTRTGRVDQLTELLRRAPYPCYASTPYHKAGYVPAPSHDPMGRVDMHLAVFSRYRIDDATRLALPLLVEPAWRQWFNLRRALLDVRMPMEGGGTFHAFNTHLSAFSHNDGTLERQVDVLDRVVTAAEDAGELYVFGGDLNALPPGDDPARLGPEEASHYNGTLTPVQRLLDRHPSAVPTRLYQADPVRWRTYLPFGAAEPDRTLDYVFLSNELELGDMQVLPITDVSDHLPLLLEITLP